MDSEFSQDLTIKGPEKINIRDLLIKQGEEIKN